MAGEQNRKFGFEIVAEDKTAEGFQSAQDGAAAMAAGVSRSGEKVNQSLSKMGDGSTSAAQKVEGSAKSLISSIQRTTAAAQAGEKGTAAYYEAIAKQRGISSDVLRPYLEQLRAVEAQQKESTKSLAGMGQTAGQTRMALQQLPMQFQDIVVSLQAGQAPMTVMLQQGSQLAGSFGGVAAAAKAMGAYVLGLVNPFTVAAAAIAAVGVAVYAAEKSLRTETAWQSYADATGRAASLSIDSFKRLRSEMALLPGVSKNMAGAVISDLAGMRDLGTAALKGIATTASDVAVLMQSDMPTAAKALGKAFSDPSKGVTELNENLRVFSAQQIATIQAMADMGDKAGAQAFMLDSLKASVSGLSHQAMTPLQQATNDLGNSWDTAMSKMSNGGPLQTATTLMAGLVQRTAEAVTWLSRLRLPKGLEDSFKGGLNGWVYDTVTGGQKPAFTGGATGTWGPSTGGASGSFGTPEVDAATQAWDAHLKKLREATDGYKSTGKAISELKDKARDLREAIAKESGKVGSEDLVERLKSNLAGVNEQLENLGKRGKSSGQDGAIAGIRARIAAEEELISRLQLYGSKAHEVSEADKLVAKLREQAARATDGWTRASKEAQLAEALRFQTLQNQRLELERNIKAQNEAEATYRKYIDTITKSAASIGDMADKQEAANDTFGKSKTAIAAMAAEQAKLAYLNAKDMGPWTPDQINALKELSDQHERYVKSLREAEYLAAKRKYDDSIKAAKDELEVQKYSMSLLGEQEVTRNKLVAIRKSELKLAKELAEIERLYKGRTDEAALKQRIELESKARINAEMELQGELTRIQDQHVTQQVQKYDDIWRQGFADMVNNGMDGLKAFGRTLKTTVLTSIADGIYQALLRKWVVNITANITGGIEGVLGLLGGGAGGGGGSGIASTANNASSLYNVGGAIWQGFSGAAVGASTASLVGANLWGAVGGDALGAMIAMNGGWAGVSVGAGAGAAAGGAAAGAGAAGTGSLAAGLSAIPVWGWIAAAVVAAIGWIVGNDDSGTPHSGSVGSYNRETGYRQVQNGMELGDASIDMGMIYGGEELAKIPQTISKGVVDVLDNLDMAFGGKGGYTVTTGFADDSSKDGAWGGLRIIGKDGKDLVNWDEGKGKWAPRVFSNGEDGLNEYLDAVALDTRKVMMESMDLPTWAKEIVGGIKEEDFNLDALQAVVTQIGQVQAVFDGLAETLVGFANISSDAMGKMAAASGGVDKLTANASTYYENFYSEAERTEKQREMINKSLSGLGLDKLDLSASDAREQFRKLVEEQLALGDSSAETVAALLALSGAVAQVTTTAEDAARAEKERAEAQAQEAERAAKAAIDFAMRSLEYATNRDINALNAQKAALAQQRTLHNESLSLITSIFQLVKSNAEDLYGDVESVVQMQALQGRAFITDALFAARKTGYLPEHDKLSEAISAARAGINDGAYATQFERDADVLKLAGQLSALEEISGKQKTFEELQLEALDNQILAIDKQTKLLQDQLALAKEALAIAQGEYDATMSTNEALAKFYALVDAYFNPVKEDSTGGGGSGSPDVLGAPGPGGSGTGGSPNRSGYYRQVNLGTGFFHVPVTNEREVARLDAAKEFWNAAPSNGYTDITDVYKDMRGMGYTAQDIAAATGLDYQDMLDSFKRHGVPAFDVGTNYVPADMYAKVHKGERIIPKADNSALMAALNGGGSGSVNAALVVEVRALREEVAALRASADRTASNTDKLPQMADQFDNVTEGGNATRVEVMA